MANRLIHFAELDRLLRRTALLRWLLHAALGIVLIFALVAPGSAQAYLLGFFFMTLPLGVVLDLFKMFMRLEVTREEARQAEHVNDDSLTYATALLLVRSRKQAKRLWYFLVYDPSVRFVLLRLGLEPERVYQTLIQSPEYAKWLEGARHAAQEERQPLHPKHFFEWMQNLPELHELWSQAGITAAQRREVWQWYARVAEEEKQAARGFADVVRLAGGIGRDWSSGYTRALTAFAVDVTKQLQQARQSIDIVGHTEERQKILQYLSRSRQHNAVLVGAEGIGKERLTYAIASDFSRGSVPINLKYKHVYSLDTGRVVSGGSQNEVEMQLHAVLEEASHIGNVVLIIPDIQLLLGMQGNDTLGVVNASAVLATYLESTQIQIIATTTSEHYYTYIKPNAVLEQNLLSVEVKELTANEALRVMQDEVGRFERTSRHVFTYPALTKIIEIAERHVHGQPYPEKALSLMDEVAAAMSRENQVFIFPHDIERILGSKLKVPMGTVSVGERAVLNNLETMIQSRIVGQHEAVKAVADALRRARAGLQSGKRPIGSFLFLGPTGVGKTEMAKTIAALYYKNEKAFIRLDMTEYQTPESITKLVGDRQTPGVLTTAMTDQPFSVVLLDEIEKAHTSVRNLFLQILDDGFLTDGYSRRVDFTNAMVIATSNAGADYIRQAVEQGTIGAQFKTQLIDWLQDKGIFLPEWLNRFDAVVTFLPLTREEILAIAKLQVQELTERLKAHNIDLTLNDDVYEVLIAKGYDPQFGARPMRRAVQDTIESALAKVLINDAQSGMKQITLTRDMLTA